MAKRRALKSRRRGNKRRRARRSLISLQAFPVPASKVVKLRYVELHTLNASAAAPDYWVFRANSVYDPDFTGTGHQPMGFDQWAIFYDHYTVIGSRCSVEFQSKDTTATGFSYVGITLSDRSSAVASPLSEAMERNNTKFKLLTGIGAGAKVTCSKNFSAKSFFGLKDISDNRGILGASVGANPPEDAYFLITQYATGGVDPTSIVAKVQIDYIVKFTERKFVPQS